MQNRIYYHAIKNSSANYIKLCSCYKNNIIKFSDGTRFSLIFLSPTYYKIYGDVLPNDIKIYRNSTTNLYYFLLKPTNTEYYISFINALPQSDGTDLKNEYGEEIDISSLTELTKNNDLDYPINRISSTVQANNTFSYTSINQQSNYSVMSSLIIINCRKTTGISGIGVYLMYKAREGTNIDYTLSPILELSYISQFSVTGTTTGFTCTSDSTTTYKVLEIANEAII